MLKAFLLSACFLPVHVCFAQVYTGWSSYGGDQGGTRYFSLTGINKRNVASLKPAWMFRTGELENYNEESLSKAAFEATPILLGNTLYFSTPSSRVFAIDAATGKK